MTHAVFVVIICAVITAALRALPFVCFGGKKGVPRLIAALGETLSPAIVTLAKAVAIVLVALAVVAFARIALTAAAVNVEVESKSYDSLIDTARSEGSSLEVAQSSLSNPSRIKAEATALGMSAPESSSKIIMPEDIVVTEGSGNISLSQSLAAAARS